MKSVRFFLLLLWGAALTASSFAGAPYVTDDPEPTEYQHWEFYLAGSLGQTPESRSGLAPQFEANYGAFPEVQLHLIAPFAFAAPEGEGTVFGYGDMEVGAKVRFLEEKDGAFQFGSYPKLEIPTGNAGEGLGAGQVQVLLPLMVQKNSGPWILNGMAGYWLNPGPGNLDWVFLGAEAQLRLSSLLTLGSEMFFQSPAHAGQEGNLGFNSGCVLDLSDRNHLMLSLGRDLVGDTTLTGFFAYQLVL